MTVSLRDGRTLVATEDRAPGGFDRPYPAEAIRAKHRALLRRGLTDEAADGVLGWCAGLPDATSVRGLPALVGARR